MLRTLEDNLACFAEIARSGSFTAAARQLGISQPAVSVRMREFEKGCGLVLLERTTRAVTLTPAGCALLPLAVSFLEKAANVQTMIEALSSQVHVSIRVDTAGILDQVRWAIIERIERRYANVDWLFEASYFADEKVRKILAHLVDLAIVWDMEPHPDVRMITVCRSPAGLALHPDSPLAAKEAISVDDLTGMTVAMAPRENAPQLYDHAARILRSARATIKAAPDYSREGLLMIPAMTGVPAVVCSAILTSAGGEPGVVFRPFEDGLSVHFYIIGHRNPPSPMVEAIWLDLEDLFRQRKPS